MRKLNVLLVLALVGAACGGTDESATIAAETTSAPATSVAESGSATTTAADESVATTDSMAPAEDDSQTETTEAAGPSFDGPPAPDFELTLSDGSTFRLSDEQKPVYIVFWAEW